MIDPTAQRVKDATDATTRASVVLEGMTHEELRSALAATTTRLHQHQSALNKMRFDCSDQVRTLEKTLDGERRHFCQSVSEARAETTRWREQALGFQADVDRLSIALRAAWSPFEAIGMLILGSALAASLTWMCLDPGWNL